MAVQETEDFKVKEHVNIEKFHSTSNALELPKVNVWDGKLKFSRTLYIKLEKFDDHYTQNIKDTALKNLEAPAVFDMCNGSQKNALYMGLNALPRTLIKQEEYPLNDNSNDYAQNNEHSRKVEQQSRKRGRLNGNTNRPTLNKTSSLNHNFIDGPDFLKSNLHRNSHLQSLLKDIIVLSREYEEVEEASLDEINKLRAKNKLPPLTNMEPYVVTEDSDFAEGSEDETKSTEWYTKDNEFESESQESGSIHRSGKQSGCNEDDEDSDRLVIDEPEDDSESEIVDVEKYCSQEGCPESISFYGALLKIDPKEPECPLCAKIFQSAGTLKQHFKLCRAKSVDLCDNGGSQEVMPESKDGLKNLKIDQIFSVGNKSGLPENEDGLSNLKIGQIFSVQDKFTNLGNRDNLSDSIEFKSENRDGLSNVKIKQVFSVENSMVHCFAKDCKFTGTTAGVTRHYRKIHITNSRYRNTCTNCDMTFESIVSWEAHYKFCNGSVFKTCIKKPKIQEETSAEIIEIDDD